MKSTNYSGKQYLFEFQTIDLKLLILKQCNIVRQKQPPEVFYKKKFLQISQNSLENTCTRVSFLIKGQVFLL